MRIDVVSIFPGYFAALDLSLPGKARRSGLLDVRVHDLRTWTHDRHRSVDDTPYGGGAGMVMRPEPWGEAFDEILGPAPEEQPVLVVPTPAGEPFTQRIAERLAGRPWLVFACGRYEGIDERVVEHARTRMPVCELSVGDYVLNGGEVAALAVIEAVIRLLPGFMGNPESLAEESHGADRLLECPVYTKPPSWRGLDVPEELLTGDHGKVAAWRHAQAVRRTARRRPDLLHPSQRLALTGMHDTEAEIRSARSGDVPELYTLQRAWLLEQAQALGGLDLPAAGEDLPSLAESLQEWTTLVVRAGGRLVASARGRLEGVSDPAAAGTSGQPAPTRPTWVITRLMVVPDLRDRGLDLGLVERLEELAPEEARAVAVLLGPGGDPRPFRKAGYRPERHAVSGETRLVKRRG